MPLLNVLSHRLASRLSSSRTRRRPIRQIHGRNACCGVERLEQRLALAAVDNTAGAQNFTTGAPVTINTQTLATATSFTIDPLIAQIGGTKYFLETGPGGWQSYTEFANPVVFTFTTPPPSGSLSFTDSVWGSFTATVILESDTPPPNGRQFDIYGTFVGGTGGGPTNPAQMPAKVQFTFTDGGPAGVGFQGGIVFPADPPVKPSDPIIVSSDIGCTSEPRVYVIDQLTGTVINSFLAYEPGFRGGVRVAIGDVDGDPSTLEITVAPGPGRSGQVRVFPLTATGPNDRIKTFDYTPFGAGYRGGVELTVGNLNGAGRDELVVSASQGAGLVKTATSDGTAFTTDKSFTAFAYPYKNGATVAIGGINQVLVANGSTKQPLVKTYDVTNAPKVLSTFSPRPPSGTGGVSLSTQNFTAGSVQSVVAGGAGARSATGVFNQTNPAIQTYGPYATSPRPNAATFAAAGKTFVADPTVSWVYTTQGPGGIDRLKRFSAAGTPDNSFQPKYNGKVLSGPLRVATRGPVLQQN